MPPDAYRRKPVMTNRRQHVAFRPFGRSLPGPRQLWAKFNQMMIVADLNGGGRAERHNGAKPLSSPEARGYHYTEARLHHFWALEARLVVADEDGSGLRMVANHVEKPWVEYEKRTLSPEQPLQCGDSPAPSSPPHPAGFFVGKPTAAGGGVECTRCGI